MQRTKETYPTFLFVIYSTRVQWQFFSTTTEVLSNQICYDIGLHYLSLDQLGFKLRINLKETWTIFSLYIFLKFYVWFRLVDMYLISVIYFISNQISLFCWVSVPNFGIYQCSNINVRWELLCTFILQAYRSNMFGTVQGPNQTISSNTTHITLLPVDI